MPLMCSLNNITWWVLIMLPFRTQQTPETSHEKSATIQRLHAYCGNARYWENYHHLYTGKKKWILKTSWVLGQLYSVSCHNFVCIIFLTCGVKLFLLLVSIYKGILIWHLFYTSLFYRCVYSMLVASVYFWLATHTLLWTTSSWN